MANIIAYTPPTPRLEPRRGPPRVLLAASLCLVVLSAGGKALARQVGPILDPVQGSTILATDALLLPSGEHLSSMADLWLVEVTNLQQSGAQSARLDPVRLSAHGHSFKQWRFLIDGIDITDPSQPGSPLVQLPMGAWQSLTFRSLWTASPHTAWRLSPALRPSSATPESDATSAPGAQTVATQVRIQGSHILGGGTWIPRGFMDREPAIDHGATPIRRGLRRGGEISLSTGPPQQRLFLSLVNNVYRYPTLVDETGKLLDDRAQQVVIGGTTTLGRNTSMFWAVQTESRRFSGAQYRFSRELSSRRNSQRLVAGLTHIIDLGDFHPVRLRLGAGWAQDRRRSNSADAVQVTDLQGEWALLHRPRWPGQDQRGFIDAGLQWRIAGIDIQAKARLWRARSDWRPPGGSVSGDGDTGELMIASTAEGLFGAPISPGMGPDIGATQTVFAGPSEQRLSGRSIRWQAERLWHLGDGRLTVNGAVDGAVVGSSGKDQLQLWWPGAGVLWQQPLAGGEFYTFLRHEPLRLTHEVARFLSPEGLSAVRYRWRDNGDRLPQPEERGEVLNRSGNPWHGQADGLRRPSNSQWGVGWHTPLFSGFRASLNGAIRLLHNRFTVEYDRASRSSFRLQGDNGLFERDMGDPSVGQEFFLLSNDKRVHPWVGSELQLRTADDDSTARGWFMSLALSGYWSLATTPFGLFPDRNDTGVINEVSADPNKQLRQSGRPDSDRSFGINLLAGTDLGGLHPSLTGWQWSTAIRYRDGEPMTSFEVHDLPQGPTVVMGVDRGDPVPRFTFHMTIDVKTRYRTSYGALTCTLYNVLGSGTEIVEDTRAGPSYRISLEMVPHRTLSCGVELLLP